MARRARRAQPIPGAVPDCQRCGACCRNPEENRTEGVDVWVEVGPGEPLLRKPQHEVLLRRDPDGGVHLRLVDGGRCIALRGALGREVRCAIYALRPAGCRRVTAGDNRCLQYRAELAQVLAAGPSATPAISSGSRS